VPGEPPLATGQRELREEAGYAAQDWHVLADCYTSPGVSTERVRVFLARGLAEAADRGPAPRHEEAGLELAWMPLERAVRLFLAGELHNGVTAVGIFAAYAAQQGGFAMLREAGARED
jgi:ADP-ribose pyrophosphatase